MFVFNPFSNTFRWRVLTGELKLQCNENNSHHSNIITADIPSDGTLQKVQSAPVAGTNSLHILASTRLSLFLEGGDVDFAPDLLQQLQQGDLLSQGGKSELHKQLNDHHLHLNNQEQQEIQQREQEVDDWIAYVFI